MIESKPGTTDSLLLPSIVREGGGVIRCAGDVSRLLMLQIEQAMDTEDFRRRQLGSHDLALISVISEAYINSFGRSNTVDPNISCVPPTYWTLAINCIVVWKKINGVVNRLAIIKCFPCGVTSVSIILFYYFGELYGCKQGYKPHCWCWVTMTRLNTVIDRQA